MDSRELIERNYQVQELQKAEGWAYLVDEAEKKLQAKRREILSGNLEHHDYIRVCGFLEGAEFILGISEHMQSKVDRIRKVEAK